MSSRVERRWCLVGVRATSCHQRPAARTWKKAWENAILGLGRVSTLAAGTSNNTTPLALRRESEPWSSSSTPRLLKIERRLLVLMMCTTDANRPLARSDNDAGWAPGGRGETPLTANAWPWPVEGHGQSDSAGGGTSYPLGVVPGSPYCWAQRHPGPQPTAPGADVDAVELPTVAKTESSRVVSACPSGQPIGALASDMARRASNRVSQTRQRYSYTGMAQGRYHGAVSGAEAPPTCPLMAVR